MKGRQQVTWKVNHLHALDKVKSWRTFLTLNTSVHKSASLQRTLTGADLEYSEKGGRDT